MQANFIELLRTFLYGDKTCQGAAEAELSKLSKSAPNDIIDLCISTLDFEDPQIAELAAASIKRYHFQNTEDFERINKEKLDLLEAKIFALLSEGERSIVLYKRLTELLAILYSKDNITYQHLLTKILTLENADNSNIKICTMYFVEVLCDFCFDEDYLKQSSAYLVQLFEKYISDTDAIVTTAAVKATITFLSNIQDKNFVKKFAQILPVLIQNLITAVRQDEASAISFMSCFDNLIESHPGFVKPVIEDILFTLTEILKEKSFSDEVRDQALNCVNVLGKNCDVAIRKSANFTNLLPVCLEILCEIKDINIDEWLEDFDDQIISKEIPYSKVQETIASLSDSLKSKFLLPKFFPYITQLIQNEQWDRIHAAYIAIGSLAAGSSTAFKGGLDQLMQLVLPGFEHQDHRVVYAAITALALLCDEYSPTLQKKYHKKIVPNLIKFMNNDGCLKLQIVATRALYNFYSKVDDEEELDKKIISPYMDDLLSSLVKLFHKAFTSNSESLFTDIFNAISILSSILDLEFGKYYNEFVPGLQKLLELTPNIDEKQTKIRLGAIECIGHVVASIRNREGFSEEVDKVIAYFTLLKKKLEKGDAEHAVILDIYSQISSHMKEQFAKYMLVIYGDVLEDLDIELKLELDGGEGSKKKFAITGKIESALLSYDNFVFDTSALTIKLSAANAIYTLSKNLGKAFYPYISATLPKICQYFNHYVKDVATKLIKTVKNLLNACEAETEKGEIMTKCLPAMLNAAQLFMSKSKLEPMHHVFKHICKGLSLISEPLLAEELLNSLVKPMYQSLALCDQEKQKIVDQVNDFDDYDDEKKEEIESEYEEVNNVMHVVMDICGRLFKVYGERVQGQILNVISPYYYKYFMGTQASFTNNETLYAICFFVDALEHSSQSAFDQMVGQAISKFVGHCKVPISTDIVQSAVYGLGVISERIDRNIFKQVKKEIVQIISGLINAEDAYSEEKAEATDNAISALGKIALFQPEKDNTESEEILIQFLDLLPLTNDQAEAKSIHRILFKEILKKNEALLSDNPEVKQALANAISNIHQFVLGNPEDEILDKESKTMLGQVMNDA